MTILGEECTTYLSSIHQLILQTLQFAFSYFVSPFISLFEQIISPLPWLKYVIVTVVSIIFLPFWSLFVLWGLIIYFADFVIRFHILFYVCNFFNFLFKFVTYKGLGCIFTSSFKFQIFKLYYKNNCHFYFLCMEYCPFILPNQNQGKAIMIYFLWYFLRMQLSRRLILGL